MKLSDMVRSLDYLAPDVTLNVNGKSSVKTYLGSFLWLLSTGCFIASMVVLLIGYLSTSSPKVNIENSSVSIYPRIDLKDSHLIPIFLVYLDETTAIPAEEVPQYATFVMQQITYKASQNEAGVYETTTEYSNWNSVPCSQLFESQQELFKILNNTLGDLAVVLPKYGVCINYTRENTTVVGKGTDTIYSGVYFGVYPCTLENSSQCKSGDEVKRVGFTYVVGEVSLNLGNYEQPVSFSYTGDEYYYLEPALYNYYTYKLMTNQVSNAKGFLTPQTILAQYATVDQKTLQVTSRDPTTSSCAFSGIMDFSCRPYFGKWIISGGRTLKYDRDYKDFVELIGDVGGAREFIFSAAFILYYFYHQQQTKKELLSSILNLHSSDLRKKRKTLKSESRKSFDQAVDQATSLIEDTLDVVTIAKKIQLIDSISDSVLPDYDMEQITKLAVSRVIKVEPEKSDVFAKAPSLRRMTISTQKSQFGRSGKVLGSVYPSKPKTIKTSRFSESGGQNKIDLPAMSPNEQRPGYDFEKNRSDSVRSIPQEGKQASRYSGQILSLLYGTSEDPAAKKILHPPPFTK